MCQNDDGAFSCNCDAGLEQAGVYPNNLCVDIEESNESSSIVADCGDNGTAVNLIGLICDSIPGHESVDTYPHVWIWMSSTLRPLLSRHAAKMVPALIELVLLDVNVSPDSEVMVDILDILYKFTL